jgi:hypothetical protein
MLFLLLSLLVSNSNAGINCVAVTNVLTGISIGGEVKFGDVYDDEDRSGLKACKNELTKKVCVTGTKTKTVTYYDGAEDGKAAESFTYDEIYAENLITHEIWTPSFFSHQTYQDLLDECDYGRIKTFMKRYPRHQAQKSWSIRE